MEFSRCTSGRLTQTRASKKDAERPFLVTSKPVSVEDLHATIYTDMGISPQHSMGIERRSFYVTKDGKPIKGVFA